MKLADLSSRRRARPWSGLAKIPWHETGFSERMLREHLSQSHDRASRRLGRIDAHVRWLHEHVRGGEPGRVLDLGCGPGLYTSRLARLGHACVGVDFSPASIAHARGEAERDGLACEYPLQDLVAAELGTGFDLALLVFGELNTFLPAEALGILARTRRALGPGGAAVLEVHTEEAVRRIGSQPPTWFTADRSVFSDEPHLCLSECAWHEQARAATEEFSVVAFDTGEVTPYVSTTQAYSEEEYEEMLARAGFGEIERTASLCGGTEEDPALTVRVARV